MGLGIRSIFLVLAVSLCSNLVATISLSKEIADAESFLKRGRILYDRGDYDSLPYFYLSAKAVFQEQNHPEKVIACFLGMADYYRVINRFDLSEATLDSTDKYISEHIGPHSLSHAEAMVNRAKLYFNNSQPTQSIALLNKTVALLQQLEADSLKMAGVMLILGANYFNMDDFQKALEYSLEAYQIHQQIEEGATVDKGRLLFNIGLTYERLGNQQKWLEYTYMGIDNNLELIDPDYSDLAQSYSSLTSFFIANGMSDSAQYYLEKSEALVRMDPGDNHRELVKLYIQRARIFLLEGNYHTALDYYQQALRIMERKGDTIGNLAGSLYVNLGNGYKSLGEYQQAEKQYLHLLNAGSTVSQTTMADHYFYLADINCLLGNYNRSESYFRKVFVIRESHLPRDHYLRSYDQLGYGILLDSLGSFGQANQYYLRALEITKSNFGEHNMQTARVLKITGDHYFLAGDLDQALDYFQQSVLAMVPDYDVADITYNPPPEKVSNNLFYLSLLKSKALVLKDKAYASLETTAELFLMEGVFDAYQVSLRIIDQLRTSYLSDLNKLYLTGNERSTYEECVASAYRCYELSADQDYLNQAFIVAEKGKYATLLSVLQREQTISLAGIPDSIVAIDADLRKELTIQQELLLVSEEDSLYDTSKIQQYQAQIFQIRARIENLNKNLERDFPGYYDLLYNQQVLKPEMLRRNLRSREMLLEFFYTEKHIYRFAISREGIQCQKIDHGYAFNSELDTVKIYLSRNFLSDSIEISHDLFLKTAHSLYEKLIPDMPGYSRLIIIPEGRLSYFPFDILVTKPVLEFSGQYKDVPFLIRDCSIRYGYSATLLDRLDNTGRIRLDKLIAFAPGYGNTSDMVASAGKFRDIPIDRTSLRPLPYSIKEVEEIGKISGGKAYTDTMASEELFKRFAGESHIIHLATHAFLDDDDPLKSKLVFSDGNVQEDGFLNVYEIYNLDLAARMVVLSACNTGTGMMKNGEGIMSLARAFIYAGVPNIVMTLWTISDRQSYKLMLGFYRQLIAGQSTESALRKAKLEFLEQAEPIYQHPRFWAGYILVGNPDRFFLPLLYKVIIPLLLIILIMVPGFILMRRRIVRRLN
jgi:CHAT domain-containing protein